MPRAPFPFQLRSSPSSGRKRCSKHAIDLAGGQIRSASLQKSFCHGDCHVHNNHASLWRGRFNLSLQPHMLALRLYLRTDPLYTMLSTIKSITTVFSERFVLPHLNYLSLQRVKDNYGRHLYNTSLPSKRNYPEDTLLAVHQIETEKKLYRKSLERKAGKTKTWDKGSLEIWSYDLHH